MKQNNENELKKNQKYKRMRLAMVSCAVLLIFSAVIGRLYYVQIIGHERYTNYSKGQYFQKVKVSQTRGQILDRNSSPIAITVPMHSIFAHPYKVKNKKEAAAKLAKHLGMSKEKILAKLNRKKNFVWLKRHLNDADYSNLKSENLVGVASIIEDKRFYPQGTLAARVIGFTGMDNQGLAGLEYRYDKTLIGSQAIYLAKKDALGRVYGYADGIVVNPNERFEMTTTIDSQIQYVTEQVVKESFDLYQAKSAVAIVMSVKNGELLAVAEQPEINPNHFSMYPANRYKSLSVTNAVEPGSTFKVFTAAAALDSGAARPEDKFYCEKGRYKIGGITIKEAMGKKYGNLTLREIIRKSSNIGAIKVAQAVGEKRFYGYIRRFGFGQHTGVDLPGESTGILRDYHKWSGTSMPSISFGQEITATPIQLITALATIGNGGIAVQPHLVSKIVKNGKTSWEFKLPRKKRVISAKAAKETIDLMLGVVRNGTGHRAYLAGYQMAGKTGTAQKFDRALGRYSRTKHISSFVALYPASDPLVAILVVVDEPTGKGWGGAVAAPMGREIALATARAAGIPSQQATRYVVNWNDLEKRYSKGAETDEDKQERLKGFVNSFFSGDFSEI